MGSWIRSFYMKKIFPGPNFFTKSSLNFLFCRNGKSSKDRLKNKKIRKITKVTDFRRAAELKGRYAGHVVRNDQERWSRPWTIVLFSANEQIGELFSLLPLEMIDGYIIVIFFTDIEEGRFEFGGSKLYTQCRMYQRWSYRTTDTFRI